MKTHLLLSFDCRRRVLISAAATILGSTLFCKSRRERFLKKLPFAVKKQNEIQVFPEDANRHMLSKMHRHFYAFMTPRGASIFARCIPCYALKNRMKILTARACVSLRGTATSRCSSSMRTA